MQRFGGGVATDPVLPLPLLLLLLELSPLTLSPVSVSTPLTLPSPEVSVPISSPEALSEELSLMPTLMSAALGTTSRSDRGVLASPAHMP